jgi:mRNA-degrading endonuclease toxin of MazEF toxin-antitoxin module
LREAFAKAGIYPRIKPGDIWKAKDASISLIDALIRTFHKERFCVVLSNKQLCDDKDWPIVLIAPLSHSLSPLAATDLHIGATDNNGLEFMSRIILSHIQPIEKVSLKECVGEISVTKWEQIVRQVFFQIDRA